MIMNLIRPAFVILLFAMVIQAQTDKFANFGPTFEKELATAGVVGASFIFVKENKPVLEEHFGMSNAETSQAVDTNTIYHWASNTKPFTGIAIMQLRDRGSLKLDDPITKYIPELRKIHNEHGSMDDITIRHLMTHSSGFRNGTWPWRNNKPWEPFEPTEWSQLVAMFPFTEVQFKPGTKFSYSNPGIIYLGRVIETLSGESYETYIDKNILRPLGMYSSFFDKTPPHLLKHRSHSYFIREGKRTEGPFDADTGITVSNSGLNSPFADMVKYLNFLIGDPKRQAEYNIVLKRSSLEEMWQPQLKAELDSNGSRGFTTDIGLLYFIDAHEGRKFVGHGGDQNGFLSYLDVEPASRSASILVMNTDITYSPDTPPGSQIVPKLRYFVRSLY